LHAFTCKEVKYHKLKKNTILILATKLPIAASRNQKEQACLEITNYKIQITNKLQITNYKLQTKEASYKQVLNARGEKREAGKPGSWEDEYDLEGTRGLAPLS